MSENGEKTYQGHDLALGNSGGFLFFEATAPGASEPQKWEMAWITQRHKAAFTAWVKSQMLAELAATKNLVSPDVYKDMLSVYEGDVLAGKYAWKKDIGSHTWTLFQKEEGWLYMGYLLLRDRQPQMTEALAAALYEDNSEGFQLVLNEVFRSPNSDTPLGKKARAAMATGKTAAEAMQSVKAAG